MRNMHVICIIVMIGLSLSACKEFPFFTDDDDSGEQPEQTIEALRTPDERFDNLPNYPFEPNYVTVQPGNLRMHYLDEGPADGPLVLLLHGNPAWTYLVREVVPILVDQGYHVIAPDLIGFGRSDKPVDRAMHTYDNQEAWVTSFVKELDLQNVHMHGHDWGGGIGLRVAIRHEERFATVAISNTGLAVGDPLPESFMIWRDSISQVIPSYAMLFDIAMATELTDEELAAYEAPYPSEEYKAGPRELPQQVPISPDDPEGIENRILTEQAWSTWEKPFIVLSGGSVGSSLTQYDSVLINIVPGAVGQPHAIVEGAGHYVQEDAPEELTRRLIDFIESSL
ncbi:MAG: haloalkane dehalogenase [Bacteroidota bacterium]